MSIHKQTADAIARAIIGRRYVNVDIFCRRYTGSPLGPRYTVRIDGELYEVSERGLIALQNGMTPEQIGLDPYDPDDEDDDWDIDDQDDYDDDYDDEEYERYLRDLAADREWFRKGAL